MGTKENKAITMEQFPTRIDLPVDTRQKIGALLNEQLADLFDLYSQTKQAHWNVKGREFFQLHQLFDRLAETLLGHLDVVAERVTALGGLAMGTVRMAASATRLPEYTPDIVGGMESIKALAVRFAHAAETTRAAIDVAEKENDIGTTDLLSEVSLDLDKGLWFLEAHIQDK